MPSAADWARYSQKMGGTGSTGNTGKTKLQKAATQLRAPLKKVPAPLSSPSAPPKGYSTGPSPTPGTYNQVAPQTSLMSYGSGGGGGYDPGPVEPPAPAFDPKVEYLKDPSYLAQISALDDALQNFNTQDTAERGRYDLDFDRGLGDLGFKDDTPDVTTDNLGNLVNGKADWGNRAWDWNDVLTASGRGYQNNINDFAGRGMAQSQAYFDSLENLGRSLDQQRDSMGDSRQGFIGEKNSAKTTYGGQDSLARKTAASQAIERLQASLGLI